MRRSGLGRDVGPVGRVRSADDFNRSYTAGGKRYTVPQTETDPLSVYGGA